LASRVMNARSYDSQDAFAVSSGRPKASACAHKISGRRPCERLLLPSFVSIDTKPTSSWWDRARCAARQQSLPPLQDTSARPRMQLHWMVSGDANVRQPKLVCGQECCTPCGSAQECVAIKRYCGCIACKQAGRRMWIHAAANPHTEVREKEEARRRRNHRQCFAANPKLQQPAKACRNRE